MRNNNYIVTLIEAARNGNVEVVEDLLNRGADINARDNFDQTALMYAARYGHHNVVELLLNHGADINAPDNFGQTALMCAANNGYLDIAQLLLNHGANDAALTLAAHYGHLDVVQLLLNHGVDIHARDNDVVELLVRQGTQFEGLDIQRLPETGVYEFSNQIAQGHIEAADALLNVTPELLNQANQFAQTPLMRAVICGQLGAVNWLIEQGAELNAVSDNGFTALYFAARALFSHRHDNEEVQAPYREMLETIVVHNPDVFEGLDIRQLPETGASEFSNQIAQGHIEAAEALLNATPELLNQANQFGQTPLMRAVICGQLGAVNWLIEQGVNVNAVSANGFTALYFAARALFSHRHDNEEVQEPYRVMLKTIVEQNPDVDEPTQAFIERDDSGILDVLIHPHTFVLK